MTSSPKHPQIELREHRPGDMGWVLERHGVLYTQEYGWNSGFEALTAQILGDFLRNFDPEYERCWIAELGGERVGSVFVVKHSGEVAKLRLLIVDPKARGLGLGNRLVDECLTFAKSRGYKKMTLWTNDVLTTARKIYVSRGFELIEEKKHSMFGPELNGQTWERAL